MTESKICTICFLKPALYLRQCFCTYCKECIANTSSICKCGGTGGLVEITNDVKNQLMNFGDDNNYIICKLFESLMSFKNAAIIQYENNLQNIESMKIHQGIRQIQHSFNKMKELESELVSLRKNNEVATVKNHGSGQTQDNLKQNFDFAPFEELLKSKKNAKT